MGCPLLKMKPCKKEECDWYVQMTGKDPNTGNPVRKGACAITWQATISLEGNQMTRELGAATESLRNRIDEANTINQEVVKTTQDFLNVVTDAVNKKSLQGD